MLGLGEGSEQSQSQPPTEKVTSYLAWPLAVASVLAFMPQGGLGLLIQLYLHQLDSAPFLISMAACLASMGILLGGVTWGALSDMTRRKPLLAALLGAGAVGVVSQSFLLPPAGVLAGFFVSLFMLTGFNPVVMRIISGGSSSLRRGRNLSILVVFRSIGFMLGSLVAGFALSSLGFRLSFIVFAAFPLAAMAFVLRLPRECVATTSKRESVFVGMGRKGLGSLYFATALRQAGMVGAFSLLFVHMASLGIAEGAMGVARSVNPAFQIPALLVFGQLADRLSRKGIFVLGFGLSVLVPVIFGFAKSALTVTTGFIILGISFTALYIGSTAYIGDRIPAERHGAMLGLYESSRGLGGVVGPLIAGAIAPVVGFQGMFFVMAGIATAGFLLVLLRRDGNPRVSHSKPSFK